MCFVECPLVLVFLMSFSWLAWDPGLLGGRPFPSHHIRGTAWLITDVDLDHPVLVSFLHVKLPFPPPFACCSLWKDVTAQPTLKEQGVIFCLSEGGICTGDLSILPHLLIYSAMYLLIPVWTHGSIFYTLDYNLFGCSDHPSFGHWGLLNFAPVSLTPTPPLFCLQSTFLLFATVTCSRLILYTAHSSRRISHFSKEPLSLENGVRLVSNWCTFGEFDDQSSWSTASMTSLAHTLCPGGLLF